jgi:valyl-tRNA synthetase
LQTSQGYIIRILQHFATKLWNITNFVMLFQAVMKFLSRSKFSLLRKWSIIECKFIYIYGQGLIYL